MEMTKTLGSMFGKIQNDMCGLSMNGGIAVKTGLLTNCLNFVFNIGEEFFFLIPTNKVENIVLDGYEYGMWDNFKEAGLINEDFIEKEIGIYDEEDY